MNEKLRDFQKNASNIITSGKSVIIVAPTGLGKTRAAILPFVKNSMPKITTGVKIRLM